MDHHDHHNTQCDEKTGLLLTQTHREEPARQYPQRHYALRGAIVALVLFVWWSFVAIPSLLGWDDYEGIEEGQLDFEDITPSEKLEWHPCYGKFTCARLTVPMDYHRPLNESKDNPKVHLALVLVPGKHQSPKKFSTSPLLLNPGGPGGPGTSFAIGLGKGIQDVVGSEQDIIGFDPRGIGETTPRADCFSYSFLGDEDGVEDYVRGSYHRLLWSFSKQSIGLVNSSAVSLQKHDSRTRALAKLCEEKDLKQGKDSIFRYLNTPNVARDMISIIDAWDEWTASVDRGSVDYEEVDEPEAEDPDTSSNPEKSYDLDTKGKLVYWGFSYGTLLGATFASMFPDRVGRIILDGVVDADHYVSPIWMESLLDTDVVYASFSKYCYKASKKCALYRANDTLADVESRLEGILSTLKERSITMIDRQSYMPVVVSFSEIKFLLFLSLYFPVQTFPGLASILNLFHQGTASTLAGLFALPPLFELQPLCGKSIPASSYPNEAQIAIMCSDKRYPLNETIPGLEDYFAKMSNISTWADVWLTQMIQCDGWRIKAVDPPMRWDDHPAHKRKPIKTSFPVFFISNTADPVTPLKAGVNMARKFVDAGLIEQKSEGHCSLAAVSRCTIGKIRAYIQEGKVPPPPVAGGEGRELVDEKWEKCEADEWPFHNYKPSESPAKRGNEGDVEVQSMIAWSHMQREFSKLDFFGQKGGLTLESMQKLVLQEQYPEGIDSV